MTFGGDVESWIFAGVESLFPNDFSSTLFVLKSFIHKSIVEIVIQNRF